jgi:hypothetical protein
MTQLIVKEYKVTWQQVDAYRKNLSPEHLFSCWNDITGEKLRRQLQIGCVTYKGKPVKLL